MCMPFADALDRRPECSISVQKWLITVQQIVDVDFVARVQILLRVFVLYPKICEKQANCAREPVKDKVLSDKKSAK